MIIRELKIETINPSTPYFAQMSFIFRKKFLQKSKYSNIFSPLYQKTNVNKLHEQLAHRNSYISLFRKKFPIKILIPFHPHFASPVITAWLTRHPSSTTPRLMYI